MEVGWELRQELEAETLEEFELLTWSQAQA